MSELKIKFFGGEPLDFPEDVQKMVNDWLKENQEIDIISTKVELSKFNDFHNIMSFTLIYKTK